MAPGEINTPIVEPFPMEGGDGPYSYSQNSLFQKGGVESAKQVFDDAIEEKQDINHLLSSSSSNKFNIADLGCSTGPNTFIIVQNIIDAINKKYKKSHPLTSLPLDFQVFFADRASNDFNKLFTSLPSDRDYFAVGVPGSFHGRLFPKASLQFVSSSFALHWLSKVPDQVADKNSPAWNKGKIHYLTASKQVQDAYSAQFAKDMETFLDARAKELVPGGLMALHVPCGASKGSNVQCQFSPLLDLLGQSLMDLAKIGSFSQDKVDSYNIPSYNPPPEELKCLIEKNGCFSIERIELVTRSGKNAHPLNAQIVAMHTRATLEAVIKEHFGCEIIDDVFDLLAKKIAESTTFFDPEHYQFLEEVFILKRKCD